MFYDYDWRDLSDDELHARLMQHGTGRDLAGWLTVRSEDHETAAAIDARLAR